MDYDYFPYKGTPCAPPAVIAPMEPSPHDKYPIYREKMPIVEPLGDNIRVPGVPALPLDNEITRIRRRIEKICDRCNALSISITDGQKRLVEHFKLDAERVNSGLRAFALTGKALRLENVLKVINTSSPRESTLRTQPRLFHNYYTNTNDYDIMEPLESAPDNTDAALFADYSIYRRNIDIVPELKGELSIAASDVLRKDYSTVIPESDMDILEKYKRVYRYLYYRIYLPYRAMCLTLSKLLYRYLPISEKPQVSEKPQEASTSTQNLTVLEPPVEISRESELLQHVERLEKPSLVGAQRVQGLPLAQAEKPTAFEEQLSNIPVNEQDFEMLKPQEQEVMFPPQEQQEQVDVVQIAPENQLRNVQDFEMWKFTPLPPQEQQEQEQEDVDVVQIAPENQLRNVQEIERWLDEILPESVPDEQLTQEQQAQVSRYLLERKKKRTFNTGDRRAHQRFEGKYY
jgi:hypothetical protein